MKQKLNRCVYFGECDFLECGHIIYHTLDEQCSEACSRARQEMWTQHDCLEHEVEIQRIRKHINPK